MNQVRILAALALATALGACALPDRLARLDGAGASPSAFQAEVTGDPPGRAFRLGLSGRD